MHLHRHARAPRRCHLQVEELESRLTPSLPPTGVEQLFLEQLNDARANPAAYGASIGLNLSGVAASQPLAFDARLIEAARLHSLDMNNRGFFSHTNPDGLGPGQRITNAGFPWTSWGESLAGGLTTTDAALSALIIDAGVPDLGHRRHLLAIDGFFRNQSQIGIGIVQNGSGPLRHYYTIDTATSADTRPFLLGVVFNDTNRNGRYDVGEGLGNVTVNIAGAGTTTTWGSGGYSFQLNPGTYTVTASGGSLSAPVVRTVTVGSANARLNFVPGTSLGPTSRFYVTGADAGSVPLVRVVDASTHQEIYRFNAYDASFAGGVRVATGDVNADGVPDIITAPGPSGGPHIRVFDGRTGTLLVSAVGNFMAYAPTFLGGIFVAAGDVNGDGYADIVTGADAGGGPHVQVFSGANGALLHSFFAYGATFTGGVRVAAGDVDGDGRDDIIAGAGAGGGPHVQVFSGANGALLRSFFAYSASVTTGVYVAAGDVDGDGRADLITGTGAGAVSHVLAFSGSTSGVLRSFYAFDPGSFFGGVRVGVVDRDGDGRVDIVTGAGPGSTPEVRVFDGLTSALADSFLAFSALFPGGVFVAGR